MALQYSKVGHQIGSAQCLTFEPGSRCEVGERPCRSRERDAARLYPVVGGQEKNTSRREGSERQIKYFD